ncbi:MAG: hypothetical protein DMG00_23450 [Acidobacteria bacterium]|nr:MAG: hypothetical protein DMG00_23450 [Acidobacteriota bacterium]
MSSQSRSAARAVVYENARLIVGDGSAAIEAGALVVQDGRITAVGRKGDVSVPANAAHVDLSGRTVMPAMINVHVHIGYEGYTASRRRSRSAAVRPIHPSSFNAIRKRANSRPPHDSCSCPAWRRPAADPMPSC